MTIARDRIGSDEDDEGDDNEVASADDPSETAVSRDAEKDRCSADSDDETVKTSINANGSCSEVKDDMEWEDIGEDETCEVLSSNGMVEELKGCDYVGNNHSNGGGALTASPAADGVVVGSKQKDSVGDAASIKCTAASGAASPPVLSVNGKHVDDEVGDYCRLSLSKECFNYVIY